MKNRSVTAHGLTFEPLIGRQEIAARVRVLGKEIRRRYEGKRPLFLGVLNGAFIFAADLVRACGDLECEVSFVRLASYEGAQSSGEVATVLGLEAAKVAGRHVVVVEDIVDTGRTLQHFLNDLKKMEPASVALAALLLKPSALQFSLEIDFLGFEVEDRFVIGCGLDYDGLGRNLEDIYALGG